MSSAAENETRPEAMRGDLSRLLDRNVVSVERIGGGRNSQVYKVADERANCFALKIYFRDAADQRDRLTTEYDSFSHLWENGFREIPRPVVKDPSRSWAIYEFVEGERIPPGQINAAALATAVDFLGRLRELSRQPGSRKLGLASEACFAPGLIVQSVQQRLQRLCATEQETASQQALHRFLTDDFAPMLEQVARWSEARLMAAGAPFRQELDWTQRTLSPSDFGFHNALQRRDGGIIFLDFEYFGWDDPAKMISDFLLHPAMNLSLDLRKKFTSGIFRRFSDWPDLMGRVEAVYPLFGLKWIMIILNEFLSASFQRRQFAAVEAPDRSALQAQQLDKARHLLHRIRQEYQNFPDRD
jgi:hypothetical protein